MPTLTEQEVFTFDQLSDDAKERAREWMREGEREDFDTEFLYESFETAAKILGIRFHTDNRGKPEIMWSGFWSQGDGASWTGWYDHAPQSPANIRKEFPEVTALHAIADGLDALQCGYRLLTGHRLNAKIKQEGRGVHEMTMDLEWVCDCYDGEELDWDSETSKRILELMRDFARWIYKSLEAEWDYRMSDEAIDEHILSGDYEFDEDGNNL